MARTVRDARLETRTARQKLPAQKEPHWRGITQGCHLGYYKGPRGGKWVARFRPDGGTYAKITLGKADDIEDADGEIVLDYGQAQDRARAWFAQMARGDVKETRGPLSVADAMRDYLAAYEAGHTRGGGKAAKDTKARIDAFIVPKLGNVLLDDLTTKRIRDWHADIAKAAPRLRTRKGEQQQHKVASDDRDSVRRRRASANRTLTILKAGLNHAFHEGDIGSDEAWRRARPFREVDVAKIRFLSHDECRRLVAATTSEFRPLVQAALLTGCRYGELAVMRVADFEEEAGTVTVRTSKGGKPRHVVLTEDGIALFRARTKDKPRDALVFSRSTGAVWGKSHQHRPLREACKLVQISPPASFHILRHSYASHLVMAGVPLQVVAANLGHADTRMTERHYAHLAPNYVANTIRAAMPRLGLVASKEEASTGSPDSSTDLDSQ